MEENNHLPNTPQRRFGPILWPLILIAIGLLLLLETLGLLGQSTWDILWDLWPLLFIALGLDALFRKREIFGPIFWIGLGGVFLLTNFGIFGWDAWTALFRLWPLLIVTAGLEILLGKRSIWLSVLVTVIVLGIMAAALGLKGLNLPSQSTIVTAISEPIGSAEQAEVHIAMSVGDLNISPLEEVDKLIKGQISADETHVQIRSSMLGDSLEYSLENDNPVMVPFDDAWQWDLALTTHIPIKLETSMGVGSMNLALNESILDNLSARQAVGEVEATLPDGIYRAEIGQAIGKLVVEIPENTPVRLEISRAISSLSLPSGFEKNNEYYYSPGAQDATAYIKIEINQAIGSITVRNQK